jgi:hypothetical protein
MSMANTPREEDSFIVLGVAAPPGGKNVVVGVSDHPEEADLRGVLSSVVPSPDFTYEVAHHGDLELGVIVVHASRDFGDAIRANAVYFRRGCLDELGYLHLDRRGAELLFQVLTERDERASIAVASNAPLSEWGQTFTDPRLAGAVVDRLTLRAHILETGAASYRLRTSQTKRKEGPPAA